MPQAAALTQDPPRDPVVERFLKFLEDNELTSEGYGRKFVCINAVKTYLEGKRTDGKPLKDLLNGLYSGVTGKPDHGTILSSRSSYVAILCILTKLGKGALIDHFVRKSLDDGRLPLSRKSRHELFPLDTGDNDFYARFCNEQWMFCAPDFTRRMDNDFEEDLILPITKKILRGSAGSGKVYEIQIHDCYNKFHDAGQAPRKKCPLTSDSQDEASNTFILKTYTTPRAPTDYKIEVNAYHILQNGDGEKRHIVNFFGNFTHVDNVTHESTYHIIMERADKGSLEEYFENQMPPSERDDIHMFWHNLLEILNALHSIHHVEDKLNGIPRVLKGWHQDVKPENILIFSKNRDNPYEFTFKLADFGTSHFKEMAECGVESTDTDSFGTSTYGAPECYRSEEWGDSSLRVKQKVDVWSFGCVLSEAAVWLSKGYHAGVQKYRKDRFSETYPKDPGLGTCFHDGIKVLESVYVWHAAVRRTKRVSDNITDKLLTIVEEEMLYQKPEGRPDPQYLWTRAKDLFPEERSLSIAVMPQNLSEVHSNSSGTSPPTQAPFTLSPESSPIAPDTPSVPNSTTSNQEITSQNHPRTDKYLQEQYQTIAKCTASIEPIKKILSFLSSAEKSLEESHLQTATNHFNEARKAIDTMKRDDNLSQMLRGLLVEQYLITCTWQTKCELAIIDQEDPPLSETNREMHLKIAEKHAQNALKAQEMLRLGTSTCEAMDLVKERRRKLANIGLTVFSSEMDRSSFV